MNIATFAMLAGALLIEWRRRGDGRRMWAALMFGLLAIVFGLRVVRAQVTSDEADQWADRVVIAAAVLFPYAMFRFTAAFERVARATDRFATVLMGSVFVWGLAIPGSLDREPRPAWLVAFIAAVLVEWVALSALVAVRFWRAGRGQAGVVRSRVRFLAVASVILSIAILVAGAGPGDRPPGVDLAFRSLVFLSAVLFFTGFKPPTPLRLVWRRHEEERLTGAVMDLMSTTTEQDVTKTLLPHVISLVGASRALLIDAQGRVIASHGDSSHTADLAEFIARRSESEGGAASEEVVEIAVPFGTMILTVSPYAPFFGPGELDALKSLGALAGLALERARLLVEEREMRAALERTDELKNAILAAVSHDLRNPLAAILGFAYVLDQRADDLPPEQRQEVLGLLSANARRLEKMLSDLLDLDRVTRGRLEPQRSLTDIAELIGRVTQHIDTQGRNVDVDALPLMATVDEAKVERILENLLLNAIRHTPSGGSIWVRARGEPDGALLVVDDEGPGVPDELKHRIFEPFERAGARGAGSGIGLFIVARFAELHGGRAWVEDRPRGGASFRVLLPDHGPEPEEANATGSRRSHNRERYRAGEQSLSRDRATSS